MATAPQLTISPLRSILLRVLFSNDVVHNRDLLSVDNYEVVPVGGGDPISIKEVSTDTSKTPSYVDIEISKPTLGSKYQLNIGRLETPNGSEFTSLFDFFISKQTKADSMLNSMSQMYDRSTKSTMANIVMAMGIIDEQIGGQGNLLPKSIDQKVQVTWISGVRVTISNNNLTKLVGTAWDGGAVSSQAISSGYGYVEFTTNENSTAKMCGLSNGDTDQHFSDLDYAIYMTQGAGLFIYEFGSLVYSPAFPNNQYAAGDVFRVEVNAGIVRYYRNSSLLYTSLVAATYPLLVDTSLYTLGGTITNAMIQV